MKIEEVILERFNFEYNNIDKEIDFILVSKEHYVNLKREMLSKINYGFYESEDILKRPIMKIKGIDISFHELIKDNRISIHFSKRV
jgi:hypothetical protein